MVKKIGLAIISSDNGIGEELYQVIQENKEYYNTVREIDLGVECILSTGSQDLVLDGVPENIICTRIAEVIADPSVDIVVDTLDDAELSKEYALAALYEGKNVVTSNVALIAKYFSELERVAKMNNCGVFFAATSIGIRTLLDGVQSDIIDQIILSADENEDPEYKLAVVSSLAFCRKVDYEKVVSEDIEVLEADLTYASILGYAIRQVAISKRTEKGVVSRICPMLLKNTTVIANCDYPTIEITGNRMGKIAISEERYVGSIAMSLISDIIYASFHSDFKYAISGVGEKSVKTTDEFDSSYYIRLNCQMNVKLLAKITSILSSSVEVLAFEQKDSIDDENEDILIITGITSETAINNLIKKFNTVEDLSVATVIRVAE